MNLEKITSGDELVSLFPDKFNANMDEIDEAVSQNASDISALDTRLTTAEEDIDAAQSDISALNQSLTHISDNGWSVIKYPDGTFEATKSMEITVGAGTAWGSGGFYYHETATIAFPSFTRNISSLMATPYGAQLLWVAGSTAFSTSETTLYIVDGTGNSGIKHLALRLTGTWT